MYMFDIDGNGVIDFRELRMITKAMGGLKFYDRNMIGMKMKKHKMGKMGKMKKPKMGKMKKMKLRQSLTARPL